ncbi:MAG: DNA cytosine methyltransferase [Patescibacteria group bacterium]
MRTSQPTAIDLFAGAGGMSLGFEQAGFDIVAAVEYDPIHAAVHEYNFPSTATICADVAQIGGTDILRQAGLDRNQVDLVFGGPPCQGFSMMGKRLSDDPRNTLVFHFCRLVLEIKPRFVVMENVAGLAIGDARSVLQGIISTLSGEGYKVRTPVLTLNAAHYGVPQDRRRLFILACRSDETLPDYPQQTHVLPHEANIFKLPQCPTVQEALGDLPNIDEFEELWESDSVRNSPGPASDYAMKLRGDIRDEGDFSRPRLFDHSLLTSSMRTAHTEISVKRFASTRGGETEPVSHFLRLAPDGICNTLRAGTASDRGAFTSPRPIHPVYPRCISVREAARLHSYPDWFRFHVTKWHGFRQIGNSVPPLLARAVAAQIIKALGVRPIKPVEPMPLGDERLLKFDMREAANHFGVSPSVIPPRRRMTEAERDDRANEQVCLAD